MGKNAVKKLVTKSEFRMRIDNGTPTITKKKRIPTKPGKAAKAKRRDAKSRRSSLKKLRGKPLDD